MSDNFQSIIKEVVNGTAKRGVGVQVRSDTPSILCKMNCNNLPMYVGQIHILNALTDFNDGKHTHGLSAELLSQIPEKMENPIFVFDSLTRPDSICMMLDLYDDMNQPIVVSIHLNGFENINGEKTDVNYITSISGKHHTGVLALMHRAVDNNKLLYVNKKEYLKVVRKLGLHFPMKKLNGYADCTVKESRNVINATVDRHHYNSFYESKHYASFEERYN